MTTFSSGLSASIRSYLTLKRALGRQYAAEEWVMGHLDRFLAARGADLIAETFAAWCLTLQHLASGTRRARMRIVRNLCLYRRRGEPGCFVPDERLFPPVHQAIRPHIFTDSEIVHLLAAAGTLTRSFKSPLRPENMRLATVVLSTTGLRRGELMRLAVGDYDPPQRTLAIRESKFHKSRLVPLSADTAREIEHVIEIRHRRRLPAGAETPLLWHRRPPSGGYSGGSFGGAMRALFHRVLPVGRKARPIERDDHLRADADKVRRPVREEGPDVDTSIAQQPIYLLHTVLGQRTHGLGQTTPHRVDRKRSARQHAQRSVGQ